MPADSPAPLPAAAAAPAPVAFAEFFVATWPHLSGYCAALVRDEVLAEEIAQEAMTRLYARLPVVRDPRAYAFRIATNFVREHWRTAGRTVPVESFAELDGPVPAAGGDLLPVVRSLPPALRDVVLLHYYADLRIEDVARVLRRPVGTIKRRLHEARAALAPLFEETR
jgi:RNA polymerase sigma-70 factor (ECF subfamily)